MFSGYNKLRVFLVLFTLIFITFITQYGLNEFVNIVPVVERIGQSYYRPFMSKEEKTSTTTLKPITVFDYRTPLEKRIYVRSAFLVSDTEIRVTIIKHYKNKKSIYFKYGPIQGEVELHCNLPKCIDAYSPSCVLVGHIGTIHFLEYLNQGINQLTLQVAGSEPIEVPIIDVRPKKQGYEHELGVCLQPIFMFAEFPVLIQFLEHWINKGATKFYMYRNSYSNEVKAILDFYEKTSNASIELVDWSDLPKIEGQQNPNAYWYRLEVMVSIFDCVHRARNTVKYIAQTDLDEMFVLNVKNKTLVEFMDDLSNANPNMAAASFVSRRAKSPASFENITSPYELDLLSMQQIYAENYYFPRPIYTKLIRMPDRSLHGHIHYSLQNEINPELNKEYKLVEVPKSKAYILHMRRVIGHNYKSRTFTQTDLLANAAQQWNDAYKERLDGYEFPIDDWDNSGLETLKTVEMCRRKHEAKRLEQCHSVHDCSQALNTSQWFQAQNSWIVL